jgi:hypothetical protein
VSQEQEAGPPAQRDPGSYRDPAGFVFRSDGVVYRQIRPSFADDWDHFLASGLYERLVAGGDIIAHEEVDVGHAADPPAYRVIRPEPLELVAYPYEWSFSQLKDAALLTLRLQVAATEAGMTLRDASAYNIQFRRGRPVLIDSLSFERSVPGRPWLPYRQFCEHFLAPLALMARVDIRLGGLLRDHLEGIPLGLAAKLLPTRTRLSLGLGPHIHLHARAQRTRTDEQQASEAGGQRREGSMSASKVAALIESLRTTVEGLRWEPTGTVWADYADNTSYDEAATAAKSAAVRAALRTAGGTRAWDLGANTGRYSRIAASEGYQVVAMDIDPGAVERAYLAIRTEGQAAITPLLADLTDPSPGLGWGGAERRGLLDRIETDVILALALVHHLAIGGNVPLPMVSALFARISAHAIVEWVPKEDAMVRRLLASREDVFDGYTERGFESAFAADFDVVSKTPIEGSLRTLYHFRRRAAPAGT